MDAVPRVEPGRAPVEVVVSDSPSSNRRPLLAYGKARISVHGRLLLVLAGHSPVRSSNNSGCPGRRSTSGSAATSPRDWPGLATARRARTRWPD